MLRAFFFVFCADVLFLFSPPCSSRFLLPFSPRVLPVFYAFSTLAGPAWGAVQLRSPGGRPESWNMGRWPPMLPRSNFIRESVDYCNRFVREDGIPTEQPAGQSVICWKNWKSLRNYWYFEGMC